jgi:hypothetical protein
MEKIINTLINSSIQGVDTYSHNGSTWLIFTESKQWVIELTESKTLWYNFNFFKNLFAYASLEVVQNQHLITKWVEDNVINAVKDTYLSENSLSKGIEHTIENGVKETCWNPEDNTSWVEGVIKKGVKSSYRRQYVPKFVIYNVMESGELETYDVDWDVPTDLIADVINDGVKEVIQEGVRSSNPRQYVGGDIIDKVIDKGVIEIHREICEYKHTIDYIIQTGVKETHDDVYHHKGRIDGVIKNGVKEMKPLPSQTGNKDWSEYSHGREDRTKPFNDYLNDTLEKGVKIN